MGSCSNLSKIPELKGTTPLWVQDMKWICLSSFGGMLLTREQKRKKPSCSHFKKLGQRRGTISQYAIYQEKRKDSKISNSHIIELANVLTIPGLSIPQLLPHQFPTSLCRELRKIYRLQWTQNNFMLMRVKHTIYWTKEIKPSSFTFIQLSILTHTFQKLRLK